MIHYTLLPEKEIKVLKKEYRTRLFIVAFFFISFSILAGVASLIPAYIYSYVQEKDALVSLQTLQDSRKERGTDSIIKELATAQTLVEELKKYRDSVDFSQVISEIIERKNSQILLNSFQVKQSEDVTKKSLDAVIQGKALTRDALLAFKKSLEQNPFISKIELPVSDLAKSKDITFALKLSIQTQ